MWSFEITKLSVPVPFILLLCFWAGSTEAEPEIYKNSKQPLEVRIKDLMKRMTLEEKIGQMTIIEEDVATPDVMKQYFIRGVMISVGNGPRPMASATEWVDMVNHIQKGALSTRLRIPTVNTTCAVHGNNVYNATIFPHNIGLGVTRDANLVKRIGAATALELTASGIPFTLAPDIADCRDPRWGRCYESYSEDHKIVQKMTQIISGLQGDIPHGRPTGVPFVSGKTKVASCVKNFVGDGGTVNGVDEANTVIDYEGLRRIHMPAYYDSIRKGVVSVLLSYTSWNGKKLHTNHALVTKVLKKKMKFQGIVLAEWSALDRITSPPHSNYTYSVEAAILSGVDMVILPYNYPEFITSLTSLVKNKYIPISRIDDAVHRILRVKFVLGLFENPLADYSFTSKLGSQKHRELPRNAVRKSLVLLKNGKGDSDPLLPLSKNVPKILVAGTHAHDLGYQCGGWTMKWQGFKGNNLTIGTTILTAIKKTVDSHTKVVYEENPDLEFMKTNKFSYAIVVVGEVPYIEMHGDSTNLTIIEPGSRTIKNVCGAIKCVVVIISGRPVVMEPYIGGIDALVAAWLPGTEGQGVADVLFGDYGFTGKLANTWFRSVNQLPMNVGDPHYDPLFPFGFGINIKLCLWCFLLLYEWDKF